MCKVALSKTPKVSCSSPTSAVVSIFDPPFFQVKFDKCLSTTIKSAVYVATWRGLKARSIRCVSQDFLKHFLKLKEFYLTFSIELYVYIYIFIIIYIYNYYIYIYKLIYVYIYIYMHIHTSSTAQGGSGSFRIGNL